MEAVIFCGIQGSGKSTYYRERFFDTHIHINLDMVRTRRREEILLLACIDAKQRFVVDNTNPTVADRRRYVAPARAAGFTVVGYYFDTAPKEAIPRNEVRSGRARIRVPSIIGTYRRLEVPLAIEGFDRLYRVRSDGAGSFTTELLQIRAP